MTTDRKALETVEKMERAYGRLDALLCVSGRGFILHLWGLPVKPSKPEVRKTLTFARTPLEPDLLMKRFRWKTGENPGWALAVGEDPGHKTLGHMLAYLGHVPLEKAVERFPLSVVLDPGDPVAGLPGAGTRAWSDGPRIETVRAALRRRLAELSPREIPPGEREPLALLVLKAYGTAGPRTGLDWYLDLLHEWIADRPADLEPFVREADSWQEERTNPEGAFLSAFWSVFSSLAMERELFGRVGPGKTTPEDDRDAKFLLEVLAHPEWKGLNGALDEALETDRTADDPRETLDRLLERHGYAGGVTGARKGLLAARSLRDPGPADPEPTL